MTVVLLFLHFVYCNVINYKSTKKSRELLLYLLLMERVVQLGC